MYALLLGGTGPVPVVTLELKDPFSFDYDVSHPLIEMEEPSTSAV